MTTFGNANAIQRTSFKNVQLFWLTDDHVCLHMTFLMEINRQTRGQKNIRYWRLIVRLGSYQLQLSAFAQLKKTSCKHDIWSEFSASFTKKDLSKVADYILRLISRLSYCWLICCVQLWSGLFMTTSQCICSKHSATCQSQQRWKQHSLLLNDPQLQHCHITVNRGKFWRI